MGQHSRGSRGPSLLQIALTLLGIVAAFVAVGFGVGALIAGPSSAPASVEPSLTTPTVTATAGVTPAVPSRAPTISVAEVRATEPSDPPTAQTFVVCIDAGHQGTGDSSLEPVGPGDPVRKPKVADGAQGVVSRTPESRINLAVAVLLEPMLVDRGIKVVMVRRSENVDISNVERAKLAGDAHADLTVRLHCNGADSQTMAGLSVQVPARAKYMASPAIIAPSKTAGRAIERSVIESTGARDLGIFPRTDLSGFNWSSVPTVVIEMGFLSNRAEDRLLNSPTYQEKLARGIAAGVQDYLATVRR
jgi:N-acetylmuramoyl-L-alanine amidase